MALIDPIDLSNISSNASDSDRLASRDELRQLNLQLPKYRILQRVGQGQFGKVFCAIERKTGQFVALKELTHQRLSTNKFLRELWSLLTLQHPHIVTCRALEETATARYLVMDYCEGGTLRELFDRGNSLTLVEAVELVLGILAGLDRAHQQGIVHCDIKPENILLTVKKGRWFARLSDFGIARRLSEAEGKRPSDGEEMEAIGAMAYAAPEGFYGLYSPAADLYSMGILLFELLLGYRPFKGKPAELMWAHLNQRLQVPPAIPEPLREVVEKALAKLPARRYSSAAQMGQALQEALLQPQVRQLCDRGLPLRSPQPEANPFLPYSVVQRELLPAPLTRLVMGEDCLYGALGSKVRIWEKLDAPAIRVDFPEPVTSLLPVRGGCMAQTGGGLYWCDRDRPQPTLLLSCDGEFQATTDGDRRWLAIAANGKLRFYSLHDLTKQPLNSPQYQRSLPVSQLPQLIFLDSRHLLAIWSDANPTKPRTLFQVYTRRGTLLGAVRLAAIFDSVMSTPMPYSLLGIARHPIPALWRIQLLPLRVSRIPLETIPACLCLVPGGYAFANQKGEIICLDREGELLGRVEGPPAPVAIAALPFTQTPCGMCLAIGSAIDSAGSIQFIDMNLTKNP